MFYISNEFYYVNLTLPRRAFLTYIIWRGEADVQWNLNIHIWYTVESLASDSSWQKEGIYHIITSAKSLICNIQTIWDKNGDVNNIFNFSRGVSSACFKFLLHAISRSWKYRADWFFPYDTWSLICEWYWEYTVCPCICISHLKVGGVKIQEHFVNIANVSVENFPYVLDLKVTYTLTLLIGGSKLPHSCLVVWPF